MTMLIVLCLFLYLLGAGIRIPKQFNMGYIMRSIVFLMLLGILFTGNTQLSAQSSEMIASRMAPEYIPEYSNVEVMNRLNAIPTKIVSHQYNPIVESYVKTYTVKNRKRTEEMLGKMRMYFPLFEQILSEANLPQELKYLSIVESALNPKATSRSGAVGLWQFMPATGKEYGLRIRSTMDERRDPEKATRAAVKYLGRLYHKFGNWELALAAYNGGPGRIARAVKRARSNDFWKITKYLPRETRNYVSAFVGATYIAHYYELHGLKPVYPAEQLLNTTSVNITNGITFSEIQSRTGIPMDWIKQLNPQYRRNYIPMSTGGHNLVLPRIEAELIRNAFTAVPQINYWLEKWQKNADYVQHDYYVQRGESIHQIAGSFMCAVEDVVKWNRLTSLSLYEGKLLTLFSKKVYKEKRSWTAVQPINIINYNKLAGHEELIPELPPNNIEFGVSTRRKNPRVIKEGKSKYYILARGESLSDVARKIPNLKLKELLKYNNIKINAQLDPGQKLKISK